MIYDEWVFHDVEHIYLQLIKKIRCAIYSGQLSAGEKIPSVREMAKIAVYGIQRSPFCFRTAVFRNQRPSLF